MATNTFPINYETNQQLTLSQPGKLFDEKVKREKAAALFMDARFRATFSQLKALLTGRRNIPMLSSRLTGKTVHGQHSRGLCTIDIDHIVGSESRSNDFDCHLNPLRDNLSERWMRIAEISMGDSSLPAIDLIQVGEEYFVRDGHHRVSVARSLGWKYIDANVTVMQL